jgi:hypothetical protein
MEMYADEPEMYGPMRKRKDFFSGFIHEHLRPKMSRSSILDFRTATTYLSQWLTKKPISSDFTLASLLHTDFSNMIPSFGANLTILIGFIVSDITGTNSYSNHLGQSLEEINQLRNYVSAEVLYGVERELQIAHRKIISDARRKPEKRHEVTQSLFLLLLVCGIAIGCAIKSSSPGVGTYYTASRMIWPLTCVKPAKDNITRLGDNLGEHLCRYLILSGRQLGLITSSENEADLYKRWLKARIMRTAIKHTTPRQSPALQETPHRCQIIQNVPQQPLALQYIPQQPPALQAPQNQVTLETPSQYQHEVSPSNLPPVSLDGYDIAESSTTPSETSPPLTFSPGTPQPAHTPYDTASDIHDIYWPADAQIVDQNGVQDFDFSFQDLLACNSYYEFYTH